MKIGTRLGPYEIVAPLGAGGMGEVYRAQDTKLGRDVAIKVLPEEFTEHPEKLARFDREARFLASLNHPSIATLHGLEKADGKPFLVMELVEGKTLAERIAGGPIPFQEAMKLAQQIAEALEAAHEKGVIHRDLKPANIKVDTEGRVKVLDFGLAKAFGDDVAESDLSQSPTLSRDATRAGVILGTAAYMSPEQARGKAVDKRTDIFSFGAVVYEMLTGKKAFLGDDVQEVLANVIKGEPDWKALPAKTPPSISALVRRCLTKDRKERLQAIGEARIAAGRYLEEPDTAPTEPAKSRATLVWQIIAAILAIALLATLRVMWPSEASPVRLSVELGAGDHQLSTEVGSGMALSPDGRTMAFVGRATTGDSQLYVRSLGSLEATPLGGTEGAVKPFFSPDGQSLGFFSDGALKRVSVDGGPPLTIADVEEVGVSSATWGPDDTIVYHPNPFTGLYRVPVSGGPPVELTSLRDDERGHRLPSFLPNGKAVLFVAEKQGETDDATWASYRATALTVEAFVLATGERKVLARDGISPRYASSGHLLFVRDATLFARAIDPDRIEPTGEPSPVLEGVRAGADGRPLFAVANDGTLAYVPGGGAVARKLVSVDRAGNGTPLIETVGDWETPRLSPDGRRLAVRRIEESGAENTWVLDLTRGTLQRLTFESGFRPLWSPGGETVFFTSNRSGRWGVFSKAADGSAPAKQLIDSASQVFPSSITSDGKTLIVRQGGDAVSSATGLDIGMLRTDGEGQREVVLGTSFDEHTPKLSPDDRWLAYVSNESGRDEVYVTRFPPASKWPISTDGGREPMWSLDGRELFYRNGKKMMAVDVSRGADNPGAPTLLFEGPYDLKEGSGASNYDVTADGRFVMIQTDERAAGPTHIVLVQNWFEELKRLVPTE